MKRTVRNLAVLAAGAAVCLVVPCLASAQGTTLEQEKRKFTDGLKKIEETNRNDCKDLNDKYVQSLRTLEESLQSAGNLDGVVAVRAEKKRFETDKTVPPEAVSDTVPGLKTLQVRCQVLAARLAVARNEGMVALCKGYAQALAELEKELTRKGDVAGAVAVRAERDKPVSAEHLTKAEFELVESKQALEKLVGNGAETEPQIPVAPGPPAAPDPSTLPSWSSFGGGGVTVYEPGTTPPDRKEIVMKSLPKFSPSAEGMTLQRITAKVLSGTTRETERYTLYRYRGSENVTLDKITWYFRIVLNARDIAAPVAKPTLLVDLFAKTGGDLEQLQHDEVRIPNLVGKDAVVVDTKGITVCKDPRRRTSAFAKDPCLYGRTFYGIVVRVLDADGTLVFQAASPPSLKVNAGDN